MWGAARHPYPATSSTHLFTTSLKFEKKGLEGIILSSSFAGAAVAAPVLDPFHLLFSLPHGIPHGALLDDDDDVHAPWSFGWRENPKPKEAAERSQWWRHPILPTSGWAD